MKAIQFSRSANRLLKAIEAGELLSYTEASKIRCEVLKHLETIKNEMYVDSSEERRVWVRESLAATDRVVALMQWHEREWMRQHKLM